MTYATWDEYLNGIERGRLSGELTEYQASTFVGTWQRAVRDVPGLRYPTSGRTEDGSVYMSWWSADRRKNLTLEIHGDGIEWMFCDCGTDGECDGTGEELEHDVPEKFFARLREVSQ